jgi:hypothetical protein
MVDADAKDVRVTLRQTSVALVSPPEYADMAHWGYYQFPDLWQGRDGRTYLAVNVGPDSEAGHHEPTRFLASPDGLNAWNPIEKDDVDFSPDVFDLPDGTQIAFGDRRFVYHYDHLSPEAERREVQLDDLGLTPVTGPVRGGYGVTEYLIYRYGDIPEALRSFPLLSRQSPKAAWQTGVGRIDEVDLFLPVLVRAMWWDEDGNAVWLAKPPLLRPPVPDQVLALPDGVLLWPHSSQHPDVTGKSYYRVICFGSTDGGRSWHVRGTIAGDSTATTWGYGGQVEQSLARMPNGDLLCAMRTKMSNEAEDTHYLAASRSADNGFTWSQVYPLAEFCVTPHLLCLANGCVALVYGRPGVHVRVSADSGDTWSESVPLVGPSEAELLARPLREWWAIRHDFSCANSDLIAAGPNRFLVAFSDFRYRAPDGTARKAIKVQEVVTEPQQDH